MTHPSGSGQGHPPIPTGGPLDLPRHNLGPLTPSSAPNKEQALDQDLARLSQCSSADPPSIYLSSSIIEGLPSETRAEY